MSDNFESLYLQICGLSNFINPKIENEFKNGGLCAELSQKAYDARCRLEDRLQSLDDADVLSIVNAYEEMQRIVAYKVYLYCTNYNSL